MEGSKKNPIKGKQISLKPKKNEILKKEGSKKDSSTIAASSTIQECDIIQTKLCGKALFDDGDNDIIYNNHTPEYDISVTPVGTPSPLKNTEPCFEIKVSSNTPFTIKFDTGGTGSIKLYRWQ
jgi:hypothetical protein